MDSLKSLRVVVSEKNKRGSEITDYIQTDWRACVLQLWDENMSREQNMSWEVIWLHNKVYNKI